jgi:hypothetical protein
LSPEIAELLQETEIILEELYSAFYSQPTTFNFSDFYDSQAAVAQGLALKIKGLNLSPLEIFFLDRSYQQLIQEFEGCYFESPQDLLAPLEGLWSFLSEDYHQWYFGHRHIFLKMYHLKMFPYKSHSGSSWAGQYHQLVHNFTYCQPKWYHLRFWWPRP